jgi:hypothetical protein
MATERSGVLRERRACGKVGRGAFALCGLGCPFLPGLLGPGLGGCQGFGCGLGRVVCVCMMVPLFRREPPQGPSDAKRGPSTIAK